MGGRRRLGRVEVERLLHESQRRVLDLSGTELVGDLTDLDFLDEFLVDTTTKRGFRNCRFTEVNCAKAHFVDCQFRDSIFQSSNFRNCIFEWCDFRFTTFRQTTFEDAFFQNCDFYRAWFEAGNIFAGGTRLDTVSLDQADLDGADLRWFAVSGGLLQEDADAYEEFLRHYGPLWESEDPDYRKLFGSVDVHVRRALRARFETAAYIYRNLSGVWAGRSYFRDSGRAYVAAKRLERRNWRELAPLAIGGDEDEEGSRRTIGGPPPRQARRGSFKASLRYITSLLADLTSGYGESIGRVLASLVLLVALSAAVYFAADGLVDTEGRRVRDVGDAVLFSIGSLIANPPNRLRAASAAIELISAVETLLGIGLVGLLGFVVGNRIRNS